MFMVYYLIATYPNAAQAEAAYQGLQTADELGEPELHLIHPGDDSLQQLSIFDPNQIAWTQSLRMLIWVIPFGFLAGFSFNSITQYSLWHLGNPLLDHLLGGILGGISGAMGGFTFGGGLQFIFDKEKMLLRNRLKKGRSLVVAKGSDLLMRQAARLLQRTAAESTQVYEGPY